MIVSRLDQTCQAPITDRVSLSYLTPVVVVGQFPRPATVSRCKVQTGSLVALQLRKPRSTAPAEAISSAGCGARIFLSGQEYPGKMILSYGAMRKKLNRKAPRDLDTRFDSLKKF